VTFFAFSAMEVLMFEAERFVADCRAAFAEDPTHKTVREVLASTVSNPAAVLKGLGEPRRAEIQKLFHSDALTIINVIWAPGMMVCLTIIECGQSLAFTRAGKTMCFGGA